MRKFCQLLLAIGAILWGLFIFFASNSPDDVLSRTSGWLSLPLLQAIPETVLTFASSPLVFATTFFILGALSLWVFTRWRESRESLPWHLKLANQMSDLISSIQNSSHHSDMNQINADFSVLRLEAKKQGLAFPELKSSFQTIQSFLPYLTNVSAHLKAGQIPEARKLAIELAEKPLLESQYRGGSGGY